jgi:hypothetical protein
VGLVLGPPRGVDALLGLLNIALVGLFDILSSVGLALVSTFFSSDLSFLACGATLFNTGAALITSLFDLISSVLMGVSSCGFDLISSILMGVSSCGFDLISSSFIGVPSDFDLISSALVRVSCGFDLISSGFIGVPSDFDLISSALVRVSCGFD